MCALSVSYWTKMHVAACQPQTMLLNHVCGSYQIVHFARQLEVEDFAVKVCVTSKSHLARRLDQRHLQREQET
eukprot:COSAG02_NODE_864_length_16407_cov_4.535197_3_plen_73_part_00